MAETGLITYPDVSSFGLSDTGVSRYQTPDPDPLPIALRDEPYQPRVLGESYLPQYRSYFPTLDDFANQPYLYVGERTGLALGESTLSQQWYYNRDGTIKPLSAIQANNAEVIAAYLVDNRSDLVREAILAGRVSETTVRQGVALIPEREAAKRRTFQAAYRNFKIAQAEDAAGFVGSPAGQFFIGFGAMAVSILAPPLAPAVAVAMGAYVLGTTVPKQVETGKVTVQDVVSELLALASIAGGVSAGVSAARAPVVPKSVPGSSAPVAQGAYLSDVPLRSGLSTSALIGQPVTGNSALVAGLFNVPVAPALSQASQLGVSVEALASATPLQSLAQSARENPGKVLGIGETVARLTDKIVKGDWEGLGNILLGAAGLPALLRPEAPSLPAVPVRQSLPGGNGQGGSSMLFSSPADPASANPWPWILGAGLLGLLFFVIRKG
jgi:hypothetical protein